ncbi:MAG: 2-oxoacid:acceptor oxidoreductase family protein [Candidatus Omnitrophica bacterium]|nr:2-oxoacid:acceptor oxidoreductase family protein [Candidatus Omnitrophota bacterium]
MKINESILTAGFGGQGVMVLGKFFANAAMASGYEVTYLPSYGAEVRGGTAHSFVKMSTEPIANPFIENPTSCIIMNGPSLIKFGDKIVKGGLLVLNTSLCDERIKRKDIDIIEVSLTEEALKLGNIKVANIIAAAIVAKRRNIISKEILEQTARNMAGKRKELVPINIKAITRGIEIASNQSS